MTTDTTYSGRRPDGSGATITVRDGRIAAITPSAVAADAPYLLPVLVDWQCNGGLGTYFNHIADDGVDTLRAIAANLRRHGVGRVLLTLTTYERTGLLASARLLGEVLDDDADLAALFPGVFHEGYYMSQLEGWRGAHKLEWLRPPNYDEITEVDDLLGGRIRVVNIAPEEPGGLDFIDRAVAAGKRVALGHCCPDAATVAEAVARGASLVTHFGNGAATQVHRHHNPFWSFLAHPELALGLICDGFHLPPDLVRAAFAAKGRAACLPVSDASGYAGMPAGDYTAMGGRRFTIAPNGFLHLTGSEILSGSWFQQDRCVEFLVRHAGFSFLDAWAQCSSVPAAAMGIDLPALAVGAEASFVLAQWSDADGLSLRAVHRGLACPETRPLDPA